MSTLGMRIKSAREKKGYMQNELANIIGVKSAGVISNWENDLNKPDAEKLVRLCNALDVSASYLLDYYGKTSLDNLVDSEKFIINSYRKLDDIDKAKITERIETLLENSKYNK